MGISAFHDHHTHVSLYGALSDCPNLHGLGTHEAWDKIRKMPKDRLSMVLGWHSGCLPIADHDLFGLPPVVIVNLSLHGMRLTPSAIELLGNSEMELVERHIDPQWCERNLDTLLAFFASMAKLTSEKLGTFMTGLERLGVHSAEDMLLTGEPALDVIRESPYADRIRCWTSPGIFRGLSSGAQAGIVGLKLFMDGAIGAKTAALAEPFQDGSPGLLCYSDQALYQELDGLVPFGKPLAIHAIGERAIEQVITVLEHMAGAGIHFPLVRLEHVQLITESQARRAKSLGLILSMQPNFSSDSRDYVDRLSDVQCVANNPFRMLIDRCGFKPGEDLIFGSDGMPHGVEHALQWSLFPDHEGQKLSLGELYKGYGIPDGVVAVEQVQVDDAGRTVRFETGH